MSPPRKMKEVTPPRLANNQIKSIVERVERLEEEKSILADDIKDVFAEAKGNGFNVKALRTIIRMRKQDANERAEQEAILDTYMIALGMLADTPLGQAAAQRELSPYQQGQSSAKRNEAAVPKYDSDTAEYQEFMAGYHAEQDRQLAAGISKIEAKAPQSGKKATEKVAKAPGKRGRPPGSGKKANGEPVAASETVLITAAEKAAKADERAQAASSGPPRKPSVQPVTRASLAAQKAAARETADSYFSRSDKTEGNA